MKKTKTKKEKPQLKLFAKKPKPLKFIYKSKQHKHELKIFLFSELKQNTKFDLKQITLLGFGWLKRDEFINLRISLLTFEIIATYEKTPRK